MTSRFGLHASGAGLTIVFDKAANTRPSVSESKLVIEKSETVVSGRKETDQLSMHYVGFCSCNLKSSKGERQSYETFGGTQLLYS